MSGKIPSDAAERWEELNEGQRSLAIEVLVNPYACHVLKRAIFQDVAGHEIGREHTDTNWIEQVHTHFGSTRTNENRSNKPRRERREAVNFGIDQLLKRYEIEKVEHLAGVVVADVAQENVVLPRQEEARTDEPINA